MSSRAPRDASAASRKTAAPRRRWPELLLLAASLALAGGLAEVVVRLVAPQVLTDDRNYRADDELGWTLKRGYRGVLTNSVDFSTRVRTNSLGMRGGEPQGRHPAILGLGDSFMFGYGVEEDEAFLTVAARELGGEALNAGVAGYDVCQAVDLGLRLLPRLDPDVVVLAIFLGNDETDAAGGRFRMELYEDTFVERWRLPKLKSWRRRLFHPVFAHSHLVRFLRWSPLTEYVEHRILGKSSPRRRAHQGLLAVYRQPPTPEVLEGDRQARECLPRLRQAADGRALPLLALLIPDRLEVYPERLAAEVAAAGEEGERFDLAAPGRRFHALLDEAGIPAFDLRPLLRAEAESGRRFYFDVDLHLNAEGSQRAGEVLAAKLREIVEESERPLSQEGEGAGE